MNTIQLESQALSGINDPLRETITTQVPIRELGVFRKYCDLFLIPLEILLQAETVLQAEALNDNTFGGLQSMERHMSEEPSEIVVLHFSPYTYDILECLASLIRMPLAKFVEGLLRMGAGTLNTYWEDAEERGPIEKCPELPSWSRQAVKFNISEKAGRPLSSVSDYTFEEYFNISIPHAKEVAR